MFRGVKYLLMFQGVKYSQRVTNGGFAGEIFMDFVAYSVSSTNHVLYCSFPISTFSCGVNLSRACLLPVALVDLSALT